VDRARRQPPHKTATIRDVAVRAGVGVGTVSRVLNGSPKVSEEARRRVGEAIAELGYRRSAVARTLSTGRTQTIGVVAPFITTGSVSERLRGVIASLRDHGDYDLMLFDVETSAQRSDAFRDFACRDRVDGLLVISLSPSDAEVEHLRRERLPVVLVDVGHPEFPHVMIDDVRGGEIATEHLLDRGHRRIGFVGDSPSLFGFVSSEQRRLGMSRALRRAGIEPDPSLERRGEHGREQARDLALTLLDSDPPTAIFAASDIQAMGVLEAAAALSLDVPRDLAVIGFDDLEVSSPLGLTTVRQPLRETGERAAELLLAAITGADRRPVEELAPLSLIVRHTT
jgi:DNA-binding LacI/PurR family transcriptional regulator